MASQKAIQEDARPVFPLAVMVSAANSLARARRLGWILSRRSAKLALAMVHLLECQPWKHWAIRLRACSGSSSRQR